MDPNAKQQIVERLKQSNNILITVSENPTVDQLAAAIGATLMFNKLDKHATAVFSGQIPSTLEFLQPEKTLEKNTDSLRDFIISLDKAKADKLRYKVEDNIVKIFITPYRTSLSEADLIFSQGDFNVDVVLALGVDAKEHIDQAIVAHGRILHDATVVTVSAGSTVSDLGSVNWQDQAASSLCEMLMSISESFQTGIVDSQMATAFLTGIVAETERFKNEKTTPKVMTMSAQLMAAGANQQLIASSLQAVQEVPVVASVPEVKNEQLPELKQAEVWVPNEEPPVLPPTQSDRLPDPVAEPTGDGRPMYDAVTGQVNAPADAVAAPPLPPQTPEEEPAPILPPVEPETPPVEEIQAPEVVEEPQPQVDVAPVEQQEEVATEPEQQDAPSPEEGVAMDVDVSSPQTPEEEPAPILPPVEPETPPVEEIQLPEVVEEPQPQVDVAPVEVVQQQPLPPAPEQKYRSPLDNLVNSPVEPDDSDGVNLDISKPTDEIAIDDEGLLHNLQEEALIEATNKAHKMVRPLSSLEPTENSEQSNEQSAKPAYATEPPSRNGTLTASSKPEVLSGSTDPFSQIISEKKSLSHDADHSVNPDQNPEVAEETVSETLPLPQPEAAPEPGVDETGLDVAVTQQEPEVAASDQETMQSALNADAARKAVLDAVNAAAYDENRPEPIKALNAQPLNMDADQKTAESAPPLPPPIMPFQIATPPGVPNQESINPSTGSLILPSPSDEEESSMPTIL